MRCIDALSPEELKDRYVLVRAGLDVPLDAHGDVADMFRVRRASETLRFLSERGAKVIVLSHIGRDPDETNAPVARALSHHVRVSYVPDLLGIAAQDARRAMRGGDILLLENLRKDPGEAGNSDSFARALAAFGDIYIDDAFSVAHREHASIVGIPKYLPKFGGLLMCEEIARLDTARAPLHPSFAILGGAKFETKAPLVRQLLASYDRVFLTGALANDVFKANGLPVGRSLISAELPGRDVLDHPNFIAPVDVTVERLDGQAFTRLPQQVEEGDKIVDIGPDTIHLIAPSIESAKFILWNGPTGMYEHGYTAWTHAIAELVAASGAQKVIGGGDTIAALQDSGVAEDRLAFLSTGGGAMLEYLLDGTLPGIAALD